MGKALNTAMDVIVAMISSLIILILIDLLWAFPVKWAWNYTMTYLFNLPSITWAHSFLLLFILTSLWKINVSVLKERK